MKPWHQFKQENPDGFYAKEYSKHTFVVYQHQLSGHLNGYVLLNPEDHIEDILDINCHGGITFEGNLAEIIQVQPGTGSVSTVLITVIWLRSIKRNLLL